MIPGLPVDAPAKGDEAELERLRRAFRQQAHEANVLRLRLQVEESKLEAMRQRRDYWRNAYVETQHQLLQVEHATSPIQQAVRHG